MEWLSQATIRLDRVLHNFNDVTMFVLETWWYGARRRKYLFHVFPWLLRVTPQWDAVPDHEVESETEWDMRFGTERVDGRLGEWV